MATRIICEKQAAVRRATARFAGDLTRPQQPRRRLRRLTEDSLSPLVLKSHLVPIERQRTAAIASRQVLAARRAATVSRPRRRPLKEQTSRWRRHLVFLGSSCFLLR